MNDEGQVVGNTYSSAGPYLYSNGALTDLNTMIDPASGWALAEAWGINNSGQIAGYGYNGGQEEAFLLTPVPEPSSLVLLGIGAASLLAYVWRRAKAA